MIFDHIAFYCQSEAAEVNIKKSLGLQNAEWVKDVVTEISEIKGERRPIQNMSMVEVQTNKSQGTNLVLLRYLDGRFWHEGELLSVPSDVPVFSHSGWLLDDNEQFPQMARHWHLVQETFTRKHTLAGQHPQHYRVYGTQGRTYVKFIKRKSADTVI